MNEDTKLPETLHEAIIYFSKGDNAHNFMVKLRWPDGKACCPRCGTSDVRFVKTRKIWECKHCETRKQFSVKVGTVFEDSPIKLDKWLSALWLISSCKNGVSSYEIHRALGVTQKTGWFMLHRIRLALQAGGIVNDKLEGTVEVDESYIGGLARNMHKSTKKRRGITGTGSVGKTAVMGLLERHSVKSKASRVVAEVIEKPTRKFSHGKVRQYVLENTDIHTDQGAHFDTLKQEFNHKVVNHAECYVKDNVHTNGLENFWSLLKRSIKGTYVSVEPYHLFRYLSEQVFRFNERKEDDHGRFLKAAAGLIGQKISYKELIGDEIVPEGMRPPSGAW